MATVLDAPVTIAQLIAWNEGSHDDLRLLHGMSFDRLVNEIVTSVTLLDPTEEQRAALGLDIAYVLRGSAIEVNHTIGGRKVEFEITDGDDAVVRVDGEEIVRYDASSVMTNDKRQNPARTESRHTMTRDEELELLKQLIHQEFYVFELHRMESGGDFEGKKVDTATEASSIRIQVLVRRHEALGGTKDDLRPIPLPFEPGRQALRL